MSAAPVWAVRLVCRIPPNWIYVRECFSESHTCETAHICWPLEVDRTHNRERSPPTTPPPQRLDSWGWGSAFIAVEERALQCVGPADAAYLLSSTRRVVSLLFSLLDISLRSFRPTTAAPPARRSSDAQVTVRSGLSAPVKKQMWRV